MNARAARSGYEPPGADTGNAPVAGALRFRLGQLVLSRSPGLIRWLWARRGLELRLDPVKQAPIRDGSKVLATVLEVTNLSCFRSGGFDIHPRSLCALIIGINELNLDFRVRQGGQPLDGIHWSH